VTPGGELRSSLSVLSAGGDALPVRSFVPAAPLRDRVECYWTLDVDAAQLPVALTALPDARVDLVFVLAGPAPQAFLAGPRTAPARYEHTKPTHLLAATLLPSAAVTAFGADLAALTPEWHPLESVSGPAAAPLAAQVAALPTLDERLAFLDVLLASRLGDAAVDGRLARAVESVERSDGTLPVAALGARSHASARHLARLFDAWMGMSPKRFARIVRAQAAARRIAGGEPSLAAVALELGFSDQAHLTRELRELFGAAPGALAKSLASLASLAKK
jgi:AraC-like DNA-binding protein